VSSKQSDASRSSPRVSEDELSVSTSNTSIRPLEQLNIITAGIATNIPTAVVTSASAIPLASAAERRYCTVKVVAPDTWVKVEFKTTFTVA